MRALLKATEKGFKLPDERGRMMRFPLRQDYIDRLKEHGLIKYGQDFVDDDRLTEAVYLDWLFRPQVGCIFAQLLAQPVYRTGVRTVVVRGRYGSGIHEELAGNVAAAVKNSVLDESTEALSVLLPQILEVESLSRFVWKLSQQPGWNIEQERLWRRTLVLVGLRVEIGTGVVAETLGMGPFEVFPTTRQCPVTTLEVRTKTKGAKVSHLSKTHLAAHLADIPVDHIMTPKKHGALRKKFTPWLKKRVLGNRGDLRAKAGITYSIPAAMWESTKFGRV